MNTGADHLTASEIETAKFRWDVIAAEVSLKRRGRELVGLCPLHPEKTPSFCVVSDKGFWICFGCGACGDVITYVMRTHHRSFPEAVHEINGTSPRKARDDEPLPRRIAPSKGPAEQVYLNGILAESRPVEPGTAAYLYLQTRGLIAPVHCGPMLAALAALRAHLSLKCVETGQSLPALIAPITSSGGVTAVQRIWVLPRVEYVNGAGPRDSRAPLAVRKKTLGEMLDGAVRLGPPRNRLGLAEGVETAIAAAILNRGMPVWATCGASRLGSVAIPMGVETVRIYGDNGDAGIEHAHRAAQAYHRQGYRVEIRFPEARFDDWNDQLVERETLR